MALYLFTPDRFFNPTTTAFTTTNSYSTNGRSNNTRSIPQEIIFPSMPLATLTFRNLNIHYPTADPLRVFKEDEIPTSAPYSDRATEFSFSLGNTPGVMTRFSMSLVGPPGLLELALRAPSWHPTSLTGLIPSP